jgi:hypothetical protein
MIPGRMSFRAGHELARAADQAGSNVGIVHPLADEVDAGVEPRPEGGELGGDVDDALARRATDEVGPRDEERIGPGPARQAQHRHLDGPVVERIGAALAATPQLELTELLAPALVDHGEVDPAPDAQPATSRQGRTVAVVEVDEGGTGAKDLEVPPGRLGEHCLLLGDEVRRDAEMLGRRGAQLGMRGAGGVQERLADAGSVDGARRAVGILELAPEASCATTVGGPQ